MENKFWALLNALGVVALATALVLAARVWVLIRPEPTVKGLRNISIVLQHRPAGENSITPPPAKKKIEGTPESARAVAIQVIERHINDFMLSSFKGACGMDRSEYINAIAEALMTYASSPEEAFWLAGMMQAESSYRLTAKPGKNTRSSARGLLQVIWRYHKDILQKAGIDKSDLYSDIALSVQGGVLVFHRYRFPRKGVERTLEEATIRYRSKSASDKEQQAYRYAATKVRDKLMKAYKTEINKK